MSFIPTDSIGKYMQKLIIFSDNIIFLIIYTFIEKSDSKEKKEEPSSVFQRQRVDLLLGELARKFPPKVVPPTQPEVKGYTLFAY